MWPAIISAAGMLGSSLFAPQGQELSSFENDPTLNPTETLHNTSDILNGVFGDALKRSSGTADLSHSYVQDVPGFAGGGLPVPVGVTGSWGGGGQPSSGTPGQVPDWFKNLPGLTGGTRGGVGEPRAPGQGTPRDPNNPQPIPPTHPNPTPTPTPGGGSHQPDRSRPTSLLPETTPDAPRRLPFQMPDSTAVTPGVNQSGAMGDPRALGAVSLLMKLAQGGGA